MSRGRGLQGVHAVDMQAVEGCWLVDWGALASRLAAGADMAAAGHGRLTQTSGTPRSRSAPGRPRGGARRWRRGRPSPATPGRDPERIRHPCSRPAIARSAPLGMRIAPQLRAVACANRGPALADQW
eukprot:13898308-Alexandrium_andersonii.AAC.1